MECIYMVESTCGESDQNMSKNIASCHGYVTHQSCVRLYEKYENMIIRVTIWKATMTLKYNQKIE